MLTDKQKLSRKRVTQLCYPFFLLLAIFSSASLNILHATELADIRKLTDMGAASLVLQLIEDKQQTFDIKTQQSEWIEWENQRLSLYENNQRWEALIERVKTYPASLPESFKLVAKQKHINAVLNTGDGETARELIQPLLWSDTHSTDVSKWLPIWQKYIIQSYIVEKSFADAHLAAQRFYQDYPNNELDDRLLRARILLMNNRADEVVTLLDKDTNEPQGGMLYLLAQLRSGERAPRKVLQSALRQMQGKWVSDELKYLLWAVVAEAARQSGNRVSAVNALEFVIAGNKNIILPAGLFEFTADTLWNAYIDYALYIGNRNQYLVGNDQQWIDAANKAAKKYPVRARSLFALVIVRGQSLDKRLQAASGFLDLMHKRKRGAEIVQRLFLSSDYFAEYKMIPEPIRFDLVDIALSRSDLVLASNLMATINKPPEGTDLLQWHLRRARIFILGGKSKQGVAAINLLLGDDIKLIERQQLDKILQVVFDLQTLEQHDQAYLLFTKILKKTDDTGLQREIYYWMADSKKAQNNYTDAAYLYLRSAILLDGKGLDPWGQTARYQAAESLGKAGLTDDARGLLQALLKVTKEPARKAVLEHELQKLWLQE